MDTSSPPVPPSVNDDSPISLLDTHVHLYPLSHCPNLSWCSPTHPLWGQHSLEEYTAATTTPIARLALSANFLSPMPTPFLQSSSQDSNSTSISTLPSSSPPIPPAQKSAPPLHLTQLIHVETDRITTLSPSDPHGMNIWREGPLDEIAFTVKLAASQSPSQSQSPPLLPHPSPPPPPSPSPHGASHLPPPSISIPRLTAIIPWAPLPAGPTILDQYLSLAEATASSPSPSPSPSTSLSTSPSTPPSNGWDKIRGFRYLVQSQPRGTMLQRGFIEGLKALGQRKEGFVFELGIDCRSGGGWQVEEAGRMIGMVNGEEGSEGEGEGGEKREGDEGGEGGEKGEEDEGGEGGRGKGKGEEGKKRKRGLVVVLNHMGKPPMDGVWNPGNVNDRQHEDGKRQVDVGVGEGSAESHSDEKGREAVLEWMEGIKRLAAFSNVVCKISGGFSEVGPRHSLPTSYPASSSTVPPSSYSHTSPSESSPTLPSEPTSTSSPLSPSPLPPPLPPPVSTSTSTPAPTPTAAAEAAYLLPLAHHLSPFLAHILLHFSSSRILFGSDWPVCSLGASPGASPGTKEIRERWGEWVWLVRWWVEVMKREGRMDGGGERGFWGGNAMGVYGVGGGKWG